MGRKARSNAALVAAALALALAGALGWWLFTMGAAAAPKADPRGTAQADGPFPAVDWEHWRQVNPRVVAWVTVPGTNIDQPIVEADPDDPDGDLHRSVDGSPSLWGTPYLDSECGPLLEPASNAIVYGHHMNDGSMFSAFADYSDPDFAEEHSTILLQTPASKLILEARAVTVVDASSASKYASFPDAASFGAWYGQMLGEADLVLDPDALPASTVTFCTCSYNVFDNERTLVTASVAKVYSGTAQVAA